MKAPALWEAHRGTMTSGQQPEVSPPSLQQILRSIVTANWSDLMRDQGDGLVDVEFRLRPDRSIEYLRLWASSHRGVCNLICQYSTFWRWSTSKTVSFGTGYRSEAMAESLAYVLQNQSSFTNASPTINGQVQVHTPSEEQKKLAGQLVGAISRFRAVPMHVG